ncbi:unnamed protein product [Linum trigynum]|uniref:Uncharacterized protein n=1 Tax=Linum trigynum TaxID=586398 RepID=A0AAV2D9J6_9ROSI
MEIGVRGERNGDQVPFYSRYSCATQKRNMISFRCRKLALLCSRGQLQRLLFHFFIISKGEGVSRWGMGKLGKMIEKEAARPF